LRLHFDLNLSVLTHDVLKTYVHEAIEGVDLLRNQAVLFEVSLDDCPRVFLVDLI
jgi:hypothetical protein